MALLFSPLTEDVVLEAPLRLRPRTAFVLHQIGEPPADDNWAYDVVVQELAGRGFEVIDASGNTGRRDYFDRIVDLIRSTAFSVAIVCGETRANATGNIMLELGLSAMIGKPWILAKAHDVDLPSDLKRTDWIEFARNDEPDFRTKLRQALDSVDDQIAFIETKIDVSLRAERVDCGIAFERIQKAYLLSGNERYRDDATTLLERLDHVPAGLDVDDISRLTDDIRTFVQRAYP